MSTSPADEILVKFCNNSNRLVSLTVDIIRKADIPNRELKQSYGKIIDDLDASKALIIPSIVGSYIEQFAEQLLPYLDMVIAKDDSMLINNLDTLLPKNPYTEKVQYIYGKNSENICYCSREDIERVWRLVHGLINNAVKFIVYSNSRSKAKVLATGVVEKLNIQF